jgi:hypothetical protein
MQTKITSILISNNAINAFLEKEALKVEKVTKELIKEVKDLKAQTSWLNVCLKAVEEKTANKYKAKAFNLPLLPKKKK